jgi:AAA domain
VVSHDTIRAALQAHPTAGQDQQAMVRDICRGGAGVALVVGRAGTGKTFALGVARHAWQLDGYRLLATAPTGIATVSLEAEGFEEVATCDRLLADLEQGRDGLDGRTVLVVDEAGMLGSRKLARLLNHAHQAQAKVVLVGDDRQLAAIDAGGGFRALRLRLRLGASELTKNRRQHHAWEREALELVRSGLVEEAVAAYRDHDRVICAESKPAATLALLQDWWQAWQESERDPAQTVVVLAARRSEVDRLNTACQQLLAAGGRLSPDRLQVQDRELAVGDRVVCGRNAIGQLGVANGTRGSITALDPKARTLTIRLDGKDPQEVTLPAWYLDGRQRGERNRRVDLAYATTGHRAQGLTRWRALVRLNVLPCATWSYLNGRPLLTCAAFPGRRWLSGRPQLRIWRLSLTQDAAMSSSTTRARWSLTAAATTRAPWGRMTPAGSLRRIWSSCWVGAELGQVWPRPVSGQPRRDANISTVEGIFRSPTSSRGAARDPATACSSRSWRTLWPWRLDRWVAATVTGRDPTWMLASSAVRCSPPPAGGNRKCSTAASGSRDTSRFP